MKHSVTLLLVVALSFSLSSCFINLKDEKNAKVELNQISVNEYSMGIPTYMTKTTTLNEDASMQFQNIFKETYVVVIDEDKAEFKKAFAELGSYDTTRSIISNYADTQLQFALENMDVISKEDMKALKIDGRLNAATTEIDATIERVQVPITYFFTYIESDYKLYTIMAWTLQSKKDVHRPTFDRMVRSFKSSH